MKLTITIPNGLAEWLDDYCKVNGHKKSTYIAFLVQRLREEKDSIGSTGPQIEGGHEWSSALQASPKPSLSDPKKKVMCAHLISIGGFCKRCGGVAK